ncbi:MAG: GDP-mannose 4,6-dehydratase [Pseudarcicella sp.]|nr:GDP-mannose 4,6-dehydratase [Pseudarcicella sp.]
MLNREIKNKTILVVGGAGFIGSHLVDRLITDGAAQVIIIDNLFTGTVENLKEAMASGKCVLFKDDAESKNLLNYIFSTFKIDTVFNLATKALNYSFTNPSDAFATNVTVVLNLLEHLRSKNFHHLCHYSTSEVYGTAVYEPMDEAHPKNPTTTYAAGKAAADLAVESYVHMFDVDAIIVRPFNNYGPRQNHLPPLAGIIPLTASKLLNGISPEIHGSGKQSRDFIYVKDTIDATLNVFKVLEKGETVNLSTGNQVTMEDLINQIVKHFDFKGEILRKPERGADVFCHNCSNEKVSKIVNYQLTPFSEGLATTLNWYKENLK